MQKLNAATPSQQQRILQLRSALHTFEQDVIRTASIQEKQNDWQSAAQTLQGGKKLRPDSHSLDIAQQQFTERRQRHEERVRMELAIHQGEQLLKDAEAYQRLQQLQGPGVLNWLELKNFDRKRRASAQSLLEYAQQAMQQQQPEDYTLAQRALTVAKGLYGDDLQQAQNVTLREVIEKNLAQANRKVRQAKPPARAYRPTPKKADKSISVADLQQALDTGDLLTAQQELKALQLAAPQHPGLAPLQVEYQQQLNARVETAIQRGNALYAQGEIERALDIWHEAKALAPENLDLAASISRAEKVLENLRALSSPQSN